MLILEEYMATLGKTNWIMLTSAAKNTKEANSSSYNKRSTS
jgi:hypothetical protein